MSLPLRILVLAGGPDRERPVSLLSGAAVAAALRQAGHTVREADITPTNLAALDMFRDWAGQIIFPLLHGKWGEGGGLQRILDEQGLPYVGSRTEAATRCMDKQRTKTLLREHGLPTPPAELVLAGEQTTLQPPVVVKAVDEGSSIGLTICHDTAQITEALDRLSREYDRLLVERYIAGMELTVGVIDRPDGGADTLPPIEIVPAAPYYDYAAKYERNDTQYRFDIGLPANALNHIHQLARQTYELLGVRHLGRVDFMVDKDHRPWLLEVNTIPGFTTHSLLPMAARQAGLPLPILVDRLVRLASH